MKTPYFLLLLLPSLSISWPIIEWSLYLAWLCVPISVWASSRYGWRGFEMIATGGLLLPIGVGTDLFTIPSDFDIYLSCLLLSVLTAHNRPITSILRSFKVTPGLAIAILLLPIYIKFGEQYEIYLNVALFPLLFLLMFLLGLAKAKIKSIIFLLFIATCFGIAIKNIYSYGYIDYYLNSFAEFIALIAWYFFGLHFRNVINDQKPTGFMARRPRITMTLLLFLWGGIVLWEFIPAIREDDHYLYLRYFIPFGTWYALPLAALYSGLNFRLKGIIIICAATIFYELLYVFPDILLDILADSENHMLIYLGEIFLKESPIIGTAFAIMGKKFIDHKKIWVNNH